MALGLGIGFARADEGVGGTLYGMWFDGVNDCVNVPDAAALSFGNGSTDSPFSGECMEFRAANFSQRRLVFSKASDISSGSAEYYFVCGTDGKLSIILFDTDIGTAASIRTTANVAINANQTYRVGFSYAGSGLASGLTIYVDGAEVASTDLTSGSYTSMNNGSSAFTIGGGFKNNATYKEFAFGVVRDVRLYNDEGLNAADIVGQWLGNGKENANWADTSGNGNNGTVAGSPARAISTDNGATWAQG